MGAAVGLWIALGLAVPASMQPVKPINLNLPASTAQAPRTLAPNFWTAPIPTPPPPRWVRALFGDPDHPPPGTRTSGSHGGARGPGFARGGHGHACHGGGHH